jgi:L-asparaginase / beta-aspartyl-peptidase
MSRFSIAIHGGAGPDSEYIRQNIQGYKDGIRRAVNAGYAILEKGGSSVDAVEAAVNEMENDPLFNAGKGAALNAKAEVELCASIMSGKHRKSGAVAIVKNVKNPVSLARAVMEKTEHIYLGSYGALDFAKKIKAPLAPDSYFITPHAYDQYDEARKKAGVTDNEIAEEQLTKRMHGTVGAVAVDVHGNVAAATSTGGTEFAKEGRIGDSSMIGVGAFAQNETCAVSTTGDGEYHILYVSAFHIAALMEYKGMTVQEACRFLIHEKCKDVEGDMGIIAVDPQGNVALEFNSERMHRGCKTCDGKLHGAIDEETSPL